MPEYQNKLRPHHDASTYTINLALNDFEKDYEVRRRDPMFLDSMLDFRVVAVVFFVITVPWLRHAAVGHWFIRVDWPISMKVYPSLKENDTSWSPLSILKTKLGQRDIQAKSTLVIIVCCFCSCSTQCAGWCYFLLRLLSPSRLKSHVYFFSVSIYDEYEPWLQVLTSV